MAIVSGIIIRAEKPHVRVVQTRFGDVDDRHRDATPGSRAAVRLPEIGSAGFLQSLDLAELVGNAGLGEQVGDVAPAALEHAEHVGRRDDLPGRQRVEDR